MKRSHLVFLIIFSVLLIDQLLKFYIKLNFEYDGGFLIAGQEWARIHFVENEGMAFGFTFGWEYGKLLLSIFRILMVSGLIWYCSHLIQLSAPTGLLVSISLITAGALGNIIDSAFYGLLFTESSIHAPAQFASAELPSYGTFLHGKVVDMFYFPITTFHLPDWFPIMGGEGFLFFSPIFNFADAAITTGVFTILLFQRRFFDEHPQLEKSNSDAHSVPTQDTKIADVENGLNEPKETTEHE